ncbi:hypothetical protein EJ07DRAFT_76492, partial [Lizonia empirigonia]
ESERQMYFENAIKETLNLPSGYVKVAVLVIRWEDDDDSDGYKAGHDTEIADLRCLLQDGFGFEFREKRLKTSTSKKPQNALNAAIAQHVDEFDDPHGLLIIYYTGHGAHRNKTNRFTATATWHKAEHSLLSSADADVLAIFDCCYASNAHKGFAEDRRIYELLAASPRGYTTPGPGPNSFTNRLITSLRELLEEHQDGSFTTTKLLDRINNKRKTPSTGASPPAMLHDRLSKFHHRHIQLARLDGQAAEQKQRVLDQQPQAEAYLELRFSLQNASMKHDQIEALARELPGAFNNANIPLCNIDW